MEATPTKTTAIDVRNYVRQATIEELYELNKTVVAQIKRTKAVANATTIAKVHVGQHGTLQGLTPQYLNDALVRIKDIKRTRVTVQLIENAPAKVAARVGYTPFTIPANCFRAL